MTKTKKHKLLRIKSIFDDEGIDVVFKKRHSDEHCYHYMTIRTSRYVIEMNESCPAMGLHIYDNENGTDINAIMGNIRICRRFMIRIVSDLTWCQSYSVELYRHHDNNEGERENLCVKDITIHELYSVWRQQ